MPIGALLAVCVKRNGLLKALLLGVSLSTTIEVLQRVLGKGMAEFDDVFHNTLGCLLGFYAVKGALTIIKQIKRRKISLKLTN